MSVPSIYLNGELFNQGRMGVEEILAKIDTSASTRDAGSLMPEKLFCSGGSGGPADAAAAVYAARKGIQPVLMNALAAKYSIYVDRELLFQLQETEEDQSWSVRRAR
jgi:alkyl hydroperoxide reductase subunit AhpF